MGVSLPGVPDRQAPTSLRGGQEISQLPSSAETSPWCAWGLTPTTRAIRSAGLHEITQI